MVVKVLMKLKIHSSESNVTGTGSQIQQKHFASILVNAKSTVASILLLSFWNYSITVLNKFSSMLDYGRCRAWQTKTPVKRESDPRTKNYLSLY